jgi:hypothetical protein
MAFKELTTGKGNANPLRQLTQQFDRERITAIEATGVAGASGVRSEYLPQTDLEREFFERQPTGAITQTDLLQQQMMGRQLTRANPSVRFSAPITGMERDTLNGKWATEYLNSFDEKFPFLVNLSVGHSVRMNLSDDEIEAIVRTGEFNVTRNQTRALDEPDTVTITKTVPYKHRKFASKLDRISRVVENGWTDEDTLTKEEVRILRQKYSVELLDANKELYRIMKKDEHILAKTQVLDDLRRRRYEDLVGNLFDPDMLSDFQRIIFETSLSISKNEVIPLNTLLREFNDDKQLLRNYFFKMLHRKKIRN